MRTKILLIILFILTFIYFYSDHIEDFYNRNLKMSYETNLYLEALSDSQILIREIFSLDKVKTGALILIKKKMYINVLSTSKYARYDEGRTPMMLASISNQYDVIKALIDNGADINAKSEDGMNIIHYALYRGDDMKTEILKLLINNGAKINEKDKNGRTPLICAANGQIDYENFNVDLFQTLLKYTTNINEADNKGINAIGYSIINEKINLFNFLINNGCDVKYKNSNNDSLLHIAAKSNLRNILITQYLIDTIGVNVVNNQNMTPLHIAAQNRSIAIATKLVNNNANYNAKDYDGNLPIHYSLNTIINDNISYKNKRTIFDDFESFYPFIIIGTNIFACNKKGETPIKLIFKYSYQLMERFFKKIIYH